MQDSPDGEFFAFSSIQNLMYEDGSQFLLSGGKSDNNAHFLAASASGADVFFITAEPLLSGDSDTTGSIYDARICGGFPKPPPLTGCEGEAYRSTATSGSSGASAPAPSAAPATKRAKGAEQSARLRRQPFRATAKGKEISKDAKRCRGANRRAGK